MENLFEKWSIEQVEDAIKLLRDLLETIMEQLRMREQEEVVPFPAHVKAKFQNKIADLRAMSPVFDGIAFPNPFDTELPVRSGMLTGIEQGLTLAKKGVIPYKTIQIIYECFARMLITFDQILQEKKAEKKD